MKRRRSRIARPRSEWTNVPVSEQCARQNPKAPILFVHYSDAPGRNLKTKAQQTAAIDAIRTYHVRHNGWSDIGYSFVLAQGWRFPFQRARIWNARGRLRVPASQQGANKGNLSVCVLANGDEQMLRTSEVAIANLARRLNASAIKGHRDVNATDCPGDRIYASLARIRKHAGL